MIDPTLLTQRAPAKLNLGLAVTGTRPDGYHDLRSVFLRIGLCDTLTARPAPADGSSEDVLTISGDPQTPIEGNLALRAVDALRTALGEPMRSLELSLTKEIPIGGGLAGGSSDAAAALELAARAWGVALSPAAALELGTGIGADVPFFLGVHPCALVTGIGEELEALPPIDRLGFLLVVPATRLSTAAVFRSFDRLGARPDSGAPSAVDSIARAFRSRVSADQLVAQLASIGEVNDLWPAACSLAPGLATLRTGVEQALGQPVLMSGSGSTLFGVYASVGEAAEAGRSLVRDRHELTAACRLFAVDQDGPDPAWREP